MTHHKRHIEQYIKEKHLFSLIEIPNIEELEEGKPFGKWVDISPSSVGPLSPMFTRISLNYTFTKSILMDGKLVVVRLILNYKYDHEIGCNSHAVILDFGDNGIIPNLFEYINKQS